MMVTEECYGALSSLSRVTVSGFNCFPLTLMTTCFFDEEALDV